jgi:O-antigen ligase
MNSKRSRSGQGDQLFNVAFSIWLFLVIVSGGSTIPSFAVWTVHLASAFLVLMVSLYRLRGGFPTGLSAAAATLLFAGLCLALLQLVPLPPDLWMRLPGREAIVQTYLNANIPLPSLPISLLPRGTLEAGTAFVFALAIFCATLSLTRRGLLVVFIAILAAAAASSLAALLQRAQGPGSVWYVQGLGSGGSSNGLFGNRNFYAAQIFTAIPILGAVATAIHQEYRIRKLVLNIFALAAVGLLLAGLALSGSRAGIILAMISLMMTIFFVYRPVSAGGFTSNMGVAALAMLAGILVVGQASMLGFLRFSGSDPLYDYRWTIFDVSKRAITDFMPFGSGFGSFVPVYQMFERPTELIDTYVNHAHNDWLEVALEGGVPGILLLVAAIGLLAVAVLRLVNSGARSTMTVLQWASFVVVMLFVAHAAVDFGVRTPALMASLTVCAAILSLVGSPLRGQNPAPAYEPRAEDEMARTERPAFRPARGHFGPAAVPGETQP